MQPCKGGCGTLTSKLYCSACRGGASARASDSVPTPCTPKSKKARRTEGLDSLTLTLYGAPRTKKTSNQLQKFGGRLKVVPSRAWMKWRDKVAESGDVQPWMRLKDQPYNCCAIFYRDADRGDTAGFITGLADLLEELGVVSNDKWLVTWDGTRPRVDKANPRTEITLTPFTE